MILAISSLFSSFRSGNVGATPETGSSYNEEKFQDYANEQYANEFGSSTAYEDNLLIVFLVDDDYYDYNYIAWVGDHIADDINLMLGGNDTELGQAMSDCINEASYKYSLDSNLAQVMRSMSDQIQTLGIDSSFSCTEDHVQVESHLTNHSHMDLTEETVNDALAAFTEATGIPVVIVVEDMDTVFSEVIWSGSVSGTGILRVVLFGAVAVGAVYLVMKLVRRKKEDPGYDNF